MAPNQSTALEMLRPIAFFALALFSVWFLKFLLHLIFVCFTLRHVPGPRPSSLIWGEEWNLYHCIPGSQYALWHRKFGRIVKFTGAFGHQILSITDPRAIAYILSEDTYRFPKPRGVRAWFKALLGEGILWVEGKEEHEKQRKVLAAAMSQQTIRDLTPIFYETAAKLASQWLNTIESGGTDQAEIEITNWASRFALDTVARAAFSYDFDCLSGECHSLAKTLDGLTNQENTLSSFYMRALFWVFPPILTIGKKGEMIRRTKKELSDTALRMLNDAEFADDTRGKTMMALMQKFNKEKMSSGELVNEEYIVAQLRTIISAGYETISATFAWILYELSINPRLQQDLRDEVASAVDPSFDDLNRKFPLLDAVLKETLRMHPPICENHHEAAETIWVPLSAPLPGSTDLHFVIPRGTTIAIPINVVHEDQAVWGADASVFRPERWLERKREGSSLRQEFLAFGQGPRVCIGKAFAIAEIKALIITLLRHFSFSCPYEIESFQSFVVRPRIKGEGPSSLPLIIRKISE